MSAEQNDAGPSPDSPNELDARIEAVDRDLTAGKRFADAVRDRLGIVLAPPIPEADRVPVDEAILRSYIEGSLPTEERERVGELVDRDPAWRGVYLGMKYPASPADPPGHG